MHPPGNRTDRRNVIMHVMQRSVGSRQGVRIEPYVLVEVMVFVTSEATNLVHDSPHAVPRWTTAIEIALFSLLRFWLPRNDATLRRKIGFIACETLVLAALAAGAMNPAIIIVASALMLRNTQFFSMRASYLFGGAAFALVLCSLVYWSRDGGVSWSTIAGWLITLTLATSMSSVLTHVAVNERTTAQSLQRANDELRRYASEAAEVAAVNERGRVAFDLHDAVGHALTALNVQLESAIRLRAVDPRTADDLLDSAKHLGTEALASVRATVAHLRADPLEREPLDVVLTRVCGRFEKTFDIAIARELACAPDDAAVTTTVTRITEEALVNVVRHAAAHTVSLALRRDGRRSVLEICDDGIGFVPADNAAGHGITIMRERAAASAIALDLRSAPGAGTTVRLSWSARFPSEDVA